MLNVDRLIEDIESVVLRTEVLLLEARIAELELRQEGTEILEDILGYTIE